MALTKVYEYYLLLLIVTLQSLNTQLIEAVVSVLDLPEAGKYIGVCYKSELSPKRAVCEEKKVVVSKQEAPFLEDFAKIPVKKKRRIDEKSCNINSNVDGDNDISMLENCVFNNCTIVINE